MRRIVIRVGTAVIAGAVLLAATACGRDEEALAREYANTATPEATAAATPAPSGTAPAGSAPPAAGPPASGPPAADSSAGEPPPAQPPTDESAAPSENGNGTGSDPSAQSRLDAALLTAAEMPPGAYEAVSNDRTELRQTARDTACQPLIDLLRPAQAAGAPTASAQASVTRGDPTPNGFTIVELFAFTDAGARNLFTQGRDALKSCASITSTDAEGETSTDAYAAIAHATLGDESLAVGMTPEAGGALGQIVVRIGSTVVVVSNADLSATTPTLPADDLVSRQIAKLTAAPRV
ncbi:hypothetical protein OG948_12615 [Embleya sp. NBC_00888]|uniref:hypothetical protein n=1 Tax=Embleya sp. NBC_00888 TaxID=2975960 RepID=UPI0038678A39|nr:hypothetical protein OG948_12615 [Embleya sp. NBC_00888]